LLPGWEVEMLGRRKEYNLSNHQHFVKVLYQNRGGWGKLGRKKIK